GHERSHFLMPRLDEADLLVGAIQRAEHAIDAIARIAIDAPNAPLIEAFDQEVTNCYRHEISPGLDWKQPRRRLPYAWCISLDRALSPGFAGFSRMTASLPDDSSLGW